jgi:hypothetical protein
MAITRLMKKGRVPVSTAVGELAGSRTTTMSPRL